MDSRNRKNEQIEGQLSSYNAQISNCLDRVKNIGGECVVVQAQLIRLQQEIEALYITLEEPLPY